MNTITGEHLHYCRTVYGERLGHRGEHEVALGLRWAGFPDDGDYDGRWVLAKALELATGYQDDRDADIEVCTPLLTRSEVKPFTIAVTDEEKAALERILFEAQDYWQVCNYADDSDDPEDAALGRLADAGLIVGYAECLDVPVTPI